MSFMNVGFEGAKRATDAILAGSFDALAVGDADALAPAAADSDAEAGDLGVCGAAVWLEPIAPREVRILPATMTSSRTAARATAQVPRLPSSSSSSSS